MGGEDCWVKADGEAFEFGVALGGEGGVAAAARTAAEEGRGAVGKPFCIDCGDSKGLMWMSSVLTCPNGLSSPSLGRRDSVEPLFLTERAVGGRSSVSRANSIWRCAICPLSSSSLFFHTGIDMQSVFRASMVDMNVAIACAEYAGGGVATFKKD